MSPARRVRSPIMGVAKQPLNRPPPLHLSFGAPFPVNILTPRCLDPFFLPPSLPPFSLVHSIHVPCTLNTRTSGSLASPPLCSLDSHRIASRRILIASIPVVSFPCFTSQANLPSSTLWRAWGVDQHDLGGHLRGGDAHLHRSIRELLPGVIIPGVLRL